MECVTIEDWIVVNPGAIFREVEGEAVILDLDTGLYFGLDAVGTRIWKLIQQHGSLRRVLEALEDTYDGPPSAVKAGLLRLVTELLDRRLLQVTRP